MIHETKAILDGVNSDVAAATTPVAKKAIYNDAISLAQTLIPAGTMQTMIVGYLQAQEKLLG